MRRRTRPAAPHTAVWSARLAALARALDRDDARTARPSTPTVPLHDALVGVVDPTDRAEVWLALAVLTGRLPEEDVVVEVARASEFDDGASLVEAVVRHTTAESATWSVRVVTSSTVVDVAHTSATSLTTGIQRVARETTRRWLRDHACLPVSWTNDLEAMRELTAIELDRLKDARAAAEDLPAERTTVVVPWRSTYLLPELAAEPARSARLRALARFSENRTGVVGFDCVPITSAETTQLGFSGVFAGNLSAVRSFDTVVTISEAARIEYAGWRAMLPAIGMTGPQVLSVPLPVEVPAASATEIAAAREQFLVGGLPLVLVVGSHEPRKNHLAVLHAAELLWREGLEFSLSFVGGNSWDSAPFQARLAEVQRNGRPIDAKSKLPDSLLWAAYRLARFTVFPSFNEGFGLPVAESLAVGTPAITSRFGSMREIAEDGGALMIDPHDDMAIAGAMRTLLVNDAALAELRVQATRRPARTWDEYAGEAWVALTGGVAG